MNSGQSALLAERTTGLDLDELSRRVRACGFDENRYVESHSDLRDAGFDGPQGLLHFLGIGYLQRRDVSCGPLADGLDGIRSLTPRNPDYILRLFRSLFYAQARHAETADRLWNGIDRSVIDCLRAMGGRPYFVIGDSHATHYLRSTSPDERWLAALRLICSGGAAMRLAAENSRSGYGARILRWARATADLAAQFELPTFLKFGGIDAEFLWVRSRMQRGAYRFSIGEFDDFAREAVSCYGRFLDALTKVMDRSLLRICAAYPAVLDDAHWVEVFLAAHSVPNRAFYASELEKMEIPNRSTRTGLRRLYNEHLREMCREKSLTFVDDFSPFVDPNGETEELCYVPHQGRDYHIS